MKFEIRARSLEKLDEILDINPDVIGVGDEGCYLKLPSVMDALKIREKTEKAGRRFRLITPQVTVGAVDKTINIIQALSKEGKGYCLTINDIGLLYGCCQKDVLPEEVAIGRTLSKSLADCKWNDHLLQHEDEHMKRTLYQNWMCQEVKISHLKNYGINAIESNMTEKQDDSFINFARSKCKIHVHYGLSAVAFSRICQTAKYYDTPVRNCVDICNGSLKIEMSQIWNEAVYYEMDDRLKEIKPTFILIGNVLYQENDLKLSDFNIFNVDSFILTFAHYRGQPSTKETYRMLDNFCNRRFVNSEKNEIESSSK